NASQVQCAVQDGGVRLGLGYIKGIARDEVRELVAERDRHGPYADLGGLAARVALRRGALEQLAWSGACDSLLRAGRDTQMGAGTQSGTGTPVGTGTQSGTSRRSALWQVGVAASAVTVAGERAPVGDENGPSTQLALPLPAPSPPRLRRLGRWQR